MYGVTFYNRNFTRRAKPAGPCAVRRLEWHAEGGPYAAVIDAPARLADYTDLLRAPVEIWDGLGTPAWWGWVDAITSARHGLGLAMEGVYNRVAASYLYSGPDEARHGRRCLTGWASATASISHYGTREHIFTLGEAGDDLAVASRDAFLLAHRYPRLQVQPAAQEVSGAEVRLHCSGWWQTLGWTYYACGASREEYPSISGEVQAVGAAAGNTRLAMGVTPTVGSWSGEVVSLSFKKVGNPADNLVVELCADSGGAPGTVLGSCTLAGSACPSGLAWQDLTLSTGVNLSTATLYWIHAYRSGANDAANHYQLRVNEGLGYAGGSLRLWDGGAWVSRAPDADLNFRLEGRQETTTQLAALLASSAAGQFFSGRRVEVESGVYTCPWREGYRTGLKEAHELLAAGYAGGARMLAAVLPSRAIRIGIVPTAAELAVGAEGALTDRWGGALCGGEIAGKLARLNGALWRPAGAPVVMDEDVFVERAVWEEGKLAIGL